MAVFKCKMCGGQLDVTGGESVAVCPYCDTQQTLPRLYDDMRANRYDRANHFRRNNEFDKAMAIYEQILTEDATDAEAYWSLVLCRYGIEYVEDPATHKRIPTVNRAQFTSVFDDDNYRSALQHADAAQRALYEQEAKAINEIQKGILAISQKEEPFDVFICYKETDDTGARTHDSVLAQDLYFQLKEEGFKVFFSRITLEDKLGTAYEPYIFAALNSAKVMVVLGTKPAHFNAVWVKNEWSRYLALIKGGAKKILIPAYKDMDPYDLPEEFSHLQAQDMSKLGFMQDLVRGIRKLAKSEEQKPTVIKETVVTGSASVAPLLKRAFLFLEDGDFESADEYCERVLDIDPENAQAYLGKLMVELEVEKQEDLAEYDETFDENSYYQKAIRFGDDRFVATLQGYAKNVEMNLAYVQAVTVMNTAASEARFKDAAALFSSICEYKDAAALRDACEEKAEVCRKNTIYNSATALMARNTVSAFEDAIMRLKTVPGWRDADVLVHTCQQKIEQIRAAERAKQMEEEHQKQIARRAAARRARNKKITLLTVLAIVLALAILTPIFWSHIQYFSAGVMTKLEKYGTAYDIYASLGDFMEAPAKAAELKEQAKAYKLENCKVGGTVLLGSYEQDGNAENGAEDILWRVLAIEGNKALVVSEYCLDARAYDSTDGATPWESSDIRAWLNGEFLETAFTSQEDNLIYNLLNETSAGSFSRDRVFLLSADEVATYFKNNGDRTAAATVFAKDAGVSYLKSNDHCGWWLRTIGGVGSRIVFVNSAGNIQYEGENVAYLYGIRPAMWIDVG